MASFAWNNLVVLILSILFTETARNRITDHGCRHLSKTKWNNLNTLGLCEFGLRKGTTRSDHEGAGPELQANGLIWEISTWVPSH
jgi:hypothetical protein